MQLVMTGELPHSPPVLLAPPALSSVDSVRGDEAASSLLLDCVRKLMRVASKEEVVGVLMDAVRDLGGSIRSMNYQGPTTLDIDLSFGSGEPLLADADDPEINALLREVLPALVDDATLTIERIESTPTDDPHGVTDPLTGLGNWGFTLRVLDRMTPGDAVAIIDLENLQQINDYYSAETGDQALLSFARTLRRVARAGDAVSRVGGTEFVWLFRASTPTDADMALGRLRRTWEAERPQPVTFSAGVAPVSPSGGNEAYVQADLALQSARRTGTNHNVVGQ
jgi:diguanylate cyclase (GGDEF)-like protein